MLMPKNVGRQGRSWRAPARSAMRWPVATGLLVAAAVHLPVTPEHLHEAPLWGIAFAGFTAVTVALGVLVARWDVPALYGATAGLCALAVATYVVSRLTPLPGIADDVGNWLNPWGVASVISEAATACVAAIALTLAPPPGVSPEEPTRGPAVREG